MDCSRLLNIATYMGVMLLESGAETYRVEETVRRMVVAYGFEETDVFAVPTCLIASVTQAGEAGTTTKVRRITGGVVIDLDRIDLLNELCRHVCLEQLPMEEVNARLEKIGERKRYSFWVRTLAAALVAVSFTLFFGGGLGDALCALPIGALCFLLTGMLERLQTNNIFRNIVGGGFIMLLAFMVARIWPELKMDTIAIGSLMNLVPGLALTNAIRDLITGEYLSGQARLIDALLTAVSIALGAGAVLSMFGRI